MPARRTILLLALLPSPLARAQDAADGEAIRAVIGAQLRAFAADDAAAAHAFAAPNIKRLFPDADTFMGMVRQGYAPVYRQRKTVFGELKLDPQLGLTQIVTLTDQEGQDWLAHYTVERQPDGNWRITGCYLVKAPGVTT